MRGAEDQFPLSIWFTYRCSVPETITGFRYGLTSSVTAACKGKVLTGIFTPAISEIGVDHLAVQLRATSAAISPDTIDRLLVEGELRGVSG